MIYFWFFLTKTSLSQKYQRRVTLFSIHKKILVPILIFSNILFAFAADDEIKADNIDSKQEIIAEVLTRHGASQPVEFDSYEEDFNWLQL